MISLNQAAAPRPTFSRGAPDFACSRVEVTAYAASACNFQPIEPAGIRVGDRMLPDHVRIIGQPQFEVDQRVDEAIWRERSRMYRKANTADM